MDKKRNHFLDIAKGVAIFLMLWGHCIQYCMANSGMSFLENGVFKFIYSFHMPLFMLISGYLFFFSFSKRDLASLLVHRTQSLLQPIVFCGIFEYLVTTVLLNVVRGKFDVIFDGQWLAKLPSLWFLWSVLAASLATAIACKKAKTLLAQVALLVAFVPFVALFPNWERNVYMYPYFVLGFYFAKYKDQLPKIVHNAKYVTLPLFPVLLCFFEKTHYIYTTGILPSDGYTLGQMLAIDAYRWLIGLVGSVFVLTVLEAIYLYIVVKVKKPILTNGLSYMGQKSIMLYAISVPFLSTYLSRIFPVFLNVLKIDNIFVKNMFIYNFVFTVLLSVAYALVLRFVIKILETLKITKMMFGK